MLKSISFIGTSEKRPFKRFLYFIFFILITAIISKIIIGPYNFAIFILFLFISIILFFYLKAYELLILIILITNEDFFALMPLEPLGKYRYQGLLYFVLIILAAWNLLFRETKNSGEKNQFIKDNFVSLMIFFSILIFIAILNTYVQGQPLLLGVKAPWGYYFVFFYFIFARKKINEQKLYQLVLIAAILLCLINNLQYINLGKINIFNYYKIADERSSRLRFLVGETFLIFSSTIAFGKFLESKKKIFLLAFLYIALTMIVQAQIRAHIFGFAITTAILLLVTRKLTAGNFIIITISIILIGLAQAAFLGNIYDLTMYELREKSGNIGIRIDAYSYYISEIMKSPIQGRGIWNYELKGNPEDMRDKGLYLDDIGIIGFIFHFGLLGAIWILALFLRVFRVFRAYDNSGLNDHYVIMGYFIFSIVTMPTLNCFAHPGKIIYLVLSLAIINQKYIDAKSKGFLNKKWM